MDNLILRGRAERAEAKVIALKVRLRKAVGLIEELNNAWRRATDEITEWKLATGLKNSAGDPNGVTSEDLRVYLKTVKEVNHDPSIGCM